MRQVFIVIWFWTFCQWKCAFHTFDILHNVFNTVWKKTFKLDMLYYIIAVMLLIVKLLIEDSLEDGSTWIFQFHNGMLKYNVHTSMFRCLNIFEFYLRCRETNHRLLWCSCESSLAFMVTIDKNIEDHIGNMEEISDGDRSG